jgi:hypothetical protein
VVSLFRILLWPKALERSRWVVVLILEQSTSNVIKSEMAEHSSVMVNLITNISHMKEAFDHAEQKNDEQQV